MNTKQNPLCDPLNVWTDFDRPSMDDWREAAQRGLRGADLDRLTSSTLGGMTVDPLYTEAEISPSPGFPGLPPFTRGSRPLGHALDGWQVCQLIADPDPDVAATLISEEIDRGATTMWCRLDAAARCGMDGDDPGSAKRPVDGLSVSKATDFGRILEVADPTRIAIRLDGGGNGISVAAAWIAALRLANVDPKSAIGDFGWDPLGSLLADGILPFGLDRSLDLVPDLAAWAHRNAPGIRSLAISTLPYHRAGASPVQEIAFAAATGVAYLRRMVESGISVNDACGQLRFTVATGRELFVEIAKLRVLRRVWSRIVEAFGGEGDCQRALIHSVTSPRCLTRRDPWVNILRTTVESLAAVAGGADSMTVLSFDDALGQPDELGRRIASNVHAIMAEESHLHRMVDPAGGSYFVENLSDQMAREVWRLFQTIEGQGGMISAITNGTITREVTTTAFSQEEVLSDRRAPITGVSSYPNLAEDPVLRISVDRAALVAAIAPGIDEHRRVNTPDRALGEITAGSPGAGELGCVMESLVAAFAAGATLGQVTRAMGGAEISTTMTPLQSQREAAEYERLRDASDLRLNQTGARPRAFLANMGSIPDHRVRADFARNLLEAGGIEVLGNDGFDTVEEAVVAFEASGTTLAAICSSDGINAQTVPDLARSLRDAGARTLVLAMKPPSRESGIGKAGIDHFIYQGCDALTTLTTILRDLGVTHE